MDISFWIQCNPNLTVEHTTKKYFGKYLYKLVVYSPAGRLIDSKDSMDSALEHRRTIAKNVNHGGWWGYRYNRDLDHADSEFLTLLRNIRHDRTLGVKLRVEEPMVQIYAESDEVLKSLITTQFDASQRGYVRSISGPKDYTAEEVLNTGAILRKKDIGYKYKVILRDGRYSSETKQHLFNYLGGLPEEQVRVPKSAWGMLRNTNHFMWNMYFYSNDTDVCTFLNLISPGIVSNFHELVVLPNK
jgi:hypothetical protein